MPKYTILKKASESRGYSIEEEETFKDIKVPLMEAQQVQTPIFAQALLHYFWHQRQNE